MPTQVISRDEISACVFDAYGTLFDVAAAARRCAPYLGENAVPLATLWRTKQLEYTWLRSLMGRFADFWQVTANALDYAMNALGIDDNQLRARLMELYLRLDPYPEVKEVLAALRAAGVVTAILSNGSRIMLTAAIGSSGLSSLIDFSFSVDKLAVYKPDPRVYQMAVDGLEIPSERICFMSSNSWDAHGASAFGFKTIWVNRFAQNRELIPEPPLCEVADLRGLSALFDL